MKRILLFLMALLLTGCAVSREPEAETTEPVAEFTKPVILYVADSPVEQQTAGAVKVFVPEEECTGIATMDGKILLVTDLSKLILMDAETGELGTSVKAGETISTGTTDFTASREGVTYYREQGNELVFLDGALRQKQTVEIPEGIMGRPCVSHVNQEVYYNKNNQIWAQHLQTGEIRLVYGEAAQSIEPLTLHLNDTVLTCRIIDGSGEESLLHLDVATGAMQEEVMQLMALQSGSGQYLVHRKDGIVEQYIYGTTDGENHILNLQEPVHTAFSLHGGYRYALEAGALQLDYYDFLTGTHSAHVRIEGVTELLSVTADSKYFWILAKAEDTEQLYRWDVTMSATGNAESFLAPLYTRENPDTQGLDQCAQRAQALTARYGIQIAVTKDMSSGYEVVEEYQVPAINRMLDELEAALAMFPEGFLQESLSEGNIRISFVRSIAGGREVVQFYEDSDACIIVAASDNMRQNILRGLAYIIDSHVLGGSTAYDDWKDLNPEGFDYDYSYYFYTNHGNSEYLTDEKRAFVDAYAMTFPYEDRSLILAYAMMDGNHTYFATETMQEKLSTICEGIRDAYSWYEEDFIWEQYL